MSSTRISLATAEDFHKGMVAYQAEKVETGERFQVLKVRMRY